ncbi:MAG: hypothetical protein MJA29_08605, partial [Candidatus Omnitrophica bacterium]|nr:hypothetical protein [Candidatus Omnitrophota bacterium]
MTAKTTHVHCLSAKTTHVHISFYPLLNNRWINLGYFLTIYPKQGKVFRKSISTQLLQYPKDVDSFSCLYKNSLFVTYVVFDLSASIFL